MKNTIDFDVTLEFPNSNEKGLFICAFERQVEISLTSLLH